MSQRCDCEYCSSMECSCEPPENPTRTMLKCGCPNTVPIPTAALPGTSFTVATVTLDLKCFCNPCVKFDFSSNIVATALTGSINFQLFKQCKNQMTPIPVGPIWNYARLVALVTDATTFGFTVCDCDSCSDDCCTYTVVATVSGVALVGVASINNASITALVVDSGCNC